MCGGLLCRPWWSAGLQQQSAALQVLIRESRNQFLFYATGRRFCQSLTAQLDLQQRQVSLSPHP